MWLLVSSLISNLKYNGMPKCTNKIITTYCLSVTFCFISMLWLNFTLRGTMWLQTLLVSFVMCKEICAQVPAMLSTGWNTKELTTLTVLICLIMVNQESSAQMNKLEVHLFQLKPTRCTLLLSIFMCAPSWLNLKKIIQECMVNKT